MAQSEMISGVDSYVLFGQETAYGTEQLTVDEHFGLVTSFRPSISNNNNFSRGFVGDTSGGRKVVKILPGPVDHSIDGEMEILNWSFMEYVLGAVTGTVTKTYTESNVPPSLTLHRSAVNPGASATDEDAIWTGCVIDSVTIRASVGQPVTCTLNIKAQNRKDDTTVVAKVELPSTEVYNFSGADIELPNGVTIPNIIDSVEMTISNNFEMRKGLGSRLTQAARARALDHKVKFTVAKLDTDLINAVKGSATPDGSTNPTEYASIECNFEKGSSSAAFLFTGFVFDEYSSDERLNEMMMEDLPGTAKSLTVTEVV